MDFPINGIQAIFHEIKGNRVKINRTSVVTLYNEKVGTEKFFRYMESLLNREKLTCKAINDVF
jgi:hypothetical protein